MVVRAFVSQCLTGSVPALTKEDPSDEDLRALPPDAIFKLAKWLTEKLEFLGWDSLSTMPDKVIFCQALRHTAWGHCQIQACR